MPEEKKTRKTTARARGSSKPADASSPGPEELAATTVVAAEQGVAAESSDRSFSPRPMEVLFGLIKLRARDVAFDGYRRFLDSVFYCPDSEAGVGDDCRQKFLSDYVSLHRTDAYQALKTATECFLMHQCGRLDEVDEVKDLDPEAIRRYREEYLQSLAGGDRNVLPYLNTIVDKLGDVRIKDFPPSDPSQQPEEGYECAPRRDHFCYGILRSRVTCPCFIELIWSYWLEEGMLVQTLKAVSLRFQNRRSRSLKNALTNLALDPLRPLNNLLWGFIEDERDRLTLSRRAFEYDHQYGLKLVGKAVPAIESADSRSQFLQSFHTVLHVAAKYFKEADDLNRKPDPFPVLNALRDTHLVLAQGAHNQFGDLPWQARVEMLVMQYLLARPEMREFLGGRVMVPFREPWMDRVEAMKKLQEWDDVSVTHYQDLASHGEQLLLSIRYADWNDDQADSDSANHWALAFRDSIQRYIHAYRAVTGVDLTQTDRDKKIDANQPSTLIERRLKGRRKVA